ncbi:MAG: outer membrane beta-barrel protein [Halopseudomonas sp.]
MINRHVLALIAVLTTLPNAAFAVELIPLWGYTGGGQLEDSITGTKIKVSSSNSMGIIAAFDSTPDKQYELLYSYQSSQLSADEGLTSSPLFDIRIQYLHFGGNYFFNGREKLSPYVAGGLGLSWIDPRVEDGDSMLRPSLNLGVGVNLMLTESLSLRGELRGYGTLIGGDTKIICSGGCNVQINGGLFTQYQVNAGIAFRF